jgi:hypothetical protein
MAVTTARSVREGNGLTGGNGRRSLLIARPAASTLAGGNGEHILITGTTSYDQNNVAEPGPGPPSAPTRPDDHDQHDAPNTLTGNAGRALSFARLGQDTITDQEAGDLVIAL